MRFANVAEYGSPTYRGFESADISAPSKKLSLRVTRVMSVNAFRQQAFAAALAPPREGGAAALGPHTGAKAMLALARSLRWLISAFHKPSTCLDPI
jgi:hypothetical protein